MWAPSTVGAFNPADDADVNLPPPRIAQSWVESGSYVAELGPTRAPKSLQSRSMPGNCRSSSAEIAQSQPRSGQRWPKLVEFGPKSAEAVQTWPITGQIWPVCIEVVPNWVQFVPTSTDFDRLRPLSDKIPPTSARNRPNLGEDHRCWVDFGKTRSALRDLMRGPRSEKLDQHRAGGHPAHNRRIARRNYNSPQRLGPNLHA